MIGRIVSWLTSGALDRVLKSIDNSIDETTERQRIRANAIQHYVEADTASRQTAMRSKVFWWAWGLFAIPLGCWWALVLIDTSIVFLDLGIPDLPQSIKPWANTVFASIFGSGAIVGAAQGISAAIIGRRR